MTAPRLVTADDLCVAAEATLVEHLGELIELLGLHVDDGDRKKFKVPTDWEQVPALEALENATNMPSGRITSPGLADKPIRRSGDTYDAVWRISVGIYDRGSNYDATSARCRKWAALVRTVLIQHPSLGGIANGVTWVGEDYRQVVQVKQARTIAGCAVAFDVAVNNVVDLSGADPLVSSTRTQVTVRPPQE